MEINPVSGCKGRRVALGVTGGIAAYKAIEVLRGFQRAGCEVRVCMTRHACEFIQPLTFRSVSGSYVIVDDYAPDNPDPIAHITFSQTVDLFVIAPTTANSLAKFANGVADDFLTSTFLACKAPVLVAPAMNTTMWHHPATQRNVARLRADGVHVLDPDEGEMACGTIGPGRLSEPEMIVAAALRILEGSKPERTANDLSGESVLITTGATRESLDPVRFISNRSSGRMGFALAEAARDRGASVTVVAAATAVSPPPHIRLIHTETAEEMHHAVMKEASLATVFIAAAAVSDYRPEQISTSKIKKSAPRLELTLERTPDILAEVSLSRRPGQIVVGFAAETNDAIPYARQKLIDKTLDMIVANDVSKENAGFDSETNVVSIIQKDNLPVIELPMMSKLDAANRILDEVANLRRQQLAIKSALTKR
jgi:phosphopantothenoylcysteine decarboxylase / phosphopantothenate---cysteine ligase